MYCIMHVACFVTITVLADITSYCHENLVMRTGYRLATNLVGWLVELHIVLRIV